MLNPELFHAAPASGLRAGDRAPITPATVQAAVDRLNADPLYGRPTQLNLPAHAGEVMVAWYRSARPGGGSPLATDIARQVMVNPYTLQIAGERNWGKIGASRRLLMPTLFHLHRYLAAGELGKTVIGISGLVLLITSIAGVVLWWPKRNRKALRHAFTISRRGSWSRFNGKLILTA
jgi:uncharacterized iron-regulated membrane protein